jgi:rRNA-processing protein FCF1
MKLFITDTNVFFDLMNIEALPEFFGLDFEICTTDFVVNEILRLEQAEQIQNFIRSKQLTVFSFSSDEIDEVVNLKTKRMLRRIADKSVLWKAFQLKCQLLTGDKSLRSEAEENGLEVHGSIWVVMKILDAELLSTEKGIELYERLKIVNDSLPKEEIEKLIRKLKS